MRVGILGGGQLGRMMALAGHPLGIHCTVLDPGEDPCAGQVCDAIRGEYENLQALYQLTQCSDVITYEFENVPVESARWLAERLPVFPPPGALEASQDRISEKSLFRELGIPTPPFMAIDSRADFDQAVAAIGLPAVLKTRRFGYDGKGQMVLKTAEDAERAWNTLGGRPLILEGFVPFDREISVIAVRDKKGQSRFYPLVENEHREGMLYRSVAPAQHCAEELTERAQEYTLRVLESLNYVGVLAIEWFQDGGQLLANEMAPRVHNSGHWTQDGAVTSQFENHLRAVTGLPLGATNATGHCGMANLIGHHPAFAEILAIPEARLHWYGKAPRAKRKIGHINVRSDSCEDRDALLTQILQLKSI